MTESILLIILGFVITLLIWGTRKYDKQTIGATFTARSEAVIRFSSMFLAAFIAHAIYAGAPNSLWYVVAVLANGFLLYGVSHFFDRLILKDRP